MKLKLNENTLNAYIQEALIRELYTQAELDAMDGNATSQNQIFQNRFQVEQFQVWYNKTYNGNLVIDGIAGPKTNAALKHYLSMANQPTGNNQGGEPTASAPEYMTV